MAESMLEQIARRFEIYADDQEAMIRRGIAKGRCKLRADLYRGVAEELRKIGSDNFDALLLDVAGAVQHGAPPHQILELFITSPFDKATEPKLSDMGLPPGTVTGKRE